MTTPQLTGEDAELVAEARKYGRTARYTGEPIPLTVSLVDRLATRLAALSAELEGAREALAELRAVVCAVELSAYPAHGTGFIVQATGALGAFQDARADALRLSPNPAPAGRGEP